MKFSKGQIIVHPQHGPATVDKLSTRKIRGESKRYLMLTVRSDGMEVALPVDLAEELGVRAVVDADGVKEIFELLVADSEPFDNVWSRRFKSYTERLRSGNLRTLAGLIRDLARRNEEKKVSYGEANILREATATFAAELAIALKVSEEQVEEMIFTAVLEREVPPLTAEALALAS
ncbi:CarD family transcriptional regulator [Pseudactinotalea sp. HY158]|uniref:CarD family transcriptional regulator n=1 Tax=unclassified Pseudactinotalea TaxID=2649176 RepID=UPI00128D5972|nr:CarD family transcriptional regulator [Pseudactinotalea sp. HY158]